MASKYDGYWQARIEKVLGLIAEALQFGKSSLFDVTDIQKYGNRKYWGTRIAIYPNTGAITEDISPDAHGKSLAKTIIHNDNYKSTKRMIRGRVSKQGQRLLLYFEIP